MEIRDDNDAMGGKATLTWTPERGQELDAAYRICVQGLALFPPPPPSSPPPPDASVDVFASAFCISALPARAVWH